MLQDKESHFEWYRNGEQTEHAIADAAGLCQEIAQDVQAFLEFRHYEFDVDAVGIETEFASDAHYEEIIPRDEHWGEGWALTCPPTFYQPGLEPGGTMLRDGKW